MASSIKDVDPNETLGPEILGAITSTWALSLIVLILRFVARKISAVGFWVDDWLAAAAFVIYTALVALFVSTVQQGAGRHIITVNPAVFPRLELLFYCGEVIFSSAVGLVKLSVLAFYWRIFSASQSIRKPIWITAAIVVAWIFASTFSTAFQCTPPMKLWQPTIPGHCSSKFAIFMGTSIPEVITDFIILAIPIPYIWGLHTAKKQKFLLTSAFLLGGFACVSSILRLWAFMTRDYASLDLTWTTAGSIEWACVEVAMAMISACLLSLRPILTWVRTGSAHPTTDAEASHAALYRSKESGAPSTRASRSRGQTVQSGKFLDAETSTTYSGKHLASDISTPHEGESPRMPPRIPEHWSERPEWAELTALPSPGLGPPLARREVISGVDLPEVVQVHDQ